LAELIQCWESLIINIVVVEMHTEFFFEFPVREHGPFLKFVGQGSQLGHDMLEFVLVYIDSSTEMCGVGDQ